MRALDLGLGLPERGVRGIDLLQLRRGQVVGQRAGQDEVAVGQPLHQGAGPQAVGPLVGEVGLAGDEESRDGGHQVVIDPEAAHRVVHGRVDSHRNLVGILAGDPLVDLEEVAILLPDLLQPEPLDGVAEVEIDAVSARPHAAALVADLLGRARGHVARHEVAEARVAALQVVIALVFGDVVGPPGVSLLLGDPDAAVVAERLRHERQLRLMLTRHRNACGVNLRVARVGEKRAAAIGPPDGGTVRRLGVGGEVEDVAVAAGGQHDRVARDTSGPRRSGGCGSRCRGPCRRPPRGRAFRCGGAWSRCRRRSDARAPGRRRAATADRSGRGRKTCARPALRRMSGSRAVRRIRGRTALPGRRTGR